LGKKSGKFNYNGSYPQETKPADRGTTTYSDGIGIYTMNEGEGGSDSVVLETTVGDSVETTNVNITNANGSAR